MLPLGMNYVSVYVQNQAVPLLFVSDGQINFRISSVQVPGPVKLRVVAEGISGPEIDLTLVLSAPALLADAGGYAMATTADGRLFTAEAPAHAGDTIVVYCTGLQDGAESPACGDSKPRGPDSGNARA